MLGCERQVSQTSGMASWLNLRVFQKLCHRLVERFRNFSQIEDRDIALATFDTSHVGAINLGQISKRLLRHLAFRSCAADRPA